MMIRSLRYLGVVLGLLLISGCGSDPDGTTGTKHDRGTTSRLDGSNWYQSLEPGSWQQIDYGASSLTDGVVNVREAGSKSDLGKTCPAPTGTCTTACGSGKTCALTKTSGSTCLTTLDLVGKAGDQAVMAPLAQAFVDCWNTQQNGLCYALKTCQLSGVVAGVCDWVCKSSTSSNFKSSADYDTARSICTCSIGLTRPVFKQNIVSGTNGKLCMWWDGAWWKQSTVILDNCSSY